ncbi:MAG: phosphoglucomutase/phosphomannomutase family protein [bacterium]
MAIKFGTDGWRAKIGEEYTFENLSKVTLAYAEYMKGKKKTPKIALGYDTRFLSETYAAFSAELLKKAGFTVNLFNKPVPTPLVSWTVKNLKLDGGIMITSSHNPATYNGFKIKNSYGAGISSAETTKIEEFIENPVKPKEAKGEVKVINYDEEYLKDISKFVDIKAINKSGLSIVVDCMYGSGAGYMESLLKGKVKAIRNYREPLFGGINPEPIKPNLVELFATVKKEKADIGLAVDGDGDRMGVVDNAGNFLSAHKALVLILLYHIKYKKFNGNFIRTVSGTFLLDRVAKECGVKLTEVPIGFKYIADIMIKEKNVIGGEESGGTGFGYYLPERDGIMSNLMLAEFVGKEKKPLTEIIKTLETKYGEYKYDRIDVEFEANKRAEIVKRVALLEKEGQVLGNKIKTTNKIDGTKFIFGNDMWLLFRFSGTEPLLRIYCEAPDENIVKKMLTFGKTMAE